MALLVILASCGQDSEITASGSGLTTTTADNQPEQEALEEDGESDAVSSTITLPEAEPFPEPDVEQTTNENLNDPSLGPVHTLCWATREATRRIVEMAFAISAVERDRIAEDFDRDRPAILRSLESVKSELGPEFAGFHSRLVEELDAVNTNDLNTIWDGFNFDLWPDADAYYAAAESAGCTQPV